MERVVESECETIANLQPGQQSDLLYRRACAVFRFAPYLNNAAIEDRLLAAGMLMVNQPGRTPWRRQQILRTIRRARERAMSEPCELVEEKPGPRLVASANGLVHTDPPQTALVPMAEPEEQISGPSAPEPEYDKKTGKLLAPIPTVADTLLGEQHFAINDGEELHIYRDGAYRDRGALVIRQSARELMDKWSARGQWKKGQADEIQERVTLVSPTLWERPPLDRINLLNGVLDLRTNKLGPHTPHWLSPIQLPVAYDHTAECPAWDAFLEAVLPSDVYRDEVTFQLCALLMIPYTAAQRALLLRGPRGTAKSRYLAGIRAFIGAENTSTKSLHTLEENRFACQYLYGKLANICPDLPHSDLESTSKFKTITGEDFIDAEYKHGRQFNFVRSADCSLARIRHLNPEMPVMRF